MTSNPNILTPEQLREIEQRVDEAMSALFALCRDLPVLLRSHKELEKQVVEWKAYADDLLENRTGLKQKVAELTAEIASLKKWEAQRDA